MKSFIEDMGKKKLLTILGIFIGLIVLIIVILLIYNGLFAKTSYKDIENKVLTAAKNYYKENSSLLPNSNSEQVTINDSALTAAGYLKSMSDLTKKMNGVSCTATVMVSYADGEYRYTPLLNCGDAYSTETLTNHITNNEQKVYTGEGLYELNGELVYRGENPNNYVKFNGKVWRIVKLENNQVVLILNEKGTKAVWDDRFNVDRNRQDGINDFSVSRMYEHLKEIYSGTTFSQDNKKLLSSYTLDIGKRSEQDDYNDGSIESSTTLEKQYVGLLPLYDYINASLDENCKSALTNSCSNYNYLRNYDYSWWTMTADSTNTYKVYKIDSTGEISALKANGSGYVRTVVTLVKDALYVSGNGTEQSPYIVK